MMFPAGMRRYLTFLVCTALCFSGAGCSRKEKDGKPDPVLTAEEAVETESEFPEEKSLWEMLGGDMVSWAASFDPAQVQQLSYVILGETREEYVVEDAARIREFFDALDQAAVLEPSDAFASDVGDSFCFQMKDGTSVTIDFCLSCLVSDGVFYETLNAEPLWELTGLLLEEQGGE